MKKVKSIPNIIDDSKGIYKASCFLIPEHPMIGQPDPSSQVLTDAGYLKHGAWCGAGWVVEGRAV